MPHVFATTQVEATPEEVFDFLSDYRNIPRLQPHFDSARLLSEKGGLGAVIELKGHFHGLHLTAIDRIITFKPPYRLVSISAGAILSRNAWELRPLDGADPPITQASFSVEYKVGGRLGGLFTGIASSIFNKEVQSLTDESLRRLHDIFAQPRDK